MRASRVALYVLLSLGICLQGFAAVRVDARCPMIQGDTSIAAEGRVAITAHMDCHADSRSHDHNRSSKHCPAGMSCQSAAPAIISVFVAPLILRDSMLRYPDPEYRFRSHSSQLLWRPPALI